MEMKMKKDILWTVTFKLEGHSYTKEYFSTLNQQLLGIKNEIVY